MSEWPHEVKITRPNAVAAAGGVQDPDTGAWTDDPGTIDDSVIYDGLGDVQDTGIEIKRDRLGAPTELSDGKCFLEDEDKTHLVKPGDILVAQMEHGDRVDARVDVVRQLDGAILFTNL